MPGSCTCVLTAFYYVAAFFKVPGAAVCDFLCPSQSCTGQKNAGTSHIVLCLGSGSYCRIAISNFGVKAIWRKSNLFVV